MVAPPKLTRVTVADAVEKYLATLPKAVATGSMSAVTAANYRRDLAEFVELVADGTILDDMTGSDLDDIVVAYASKPDGRFKNPGDRTRSLGTTTRFKQSVSRLFTHAERHGWVQLSPIPDMTVTLKGHRKAKASRLALPQTSAEALLNAVAAPQDKPRRDDQDMQVRDEFILRVLMEVGPRVSEFVKADRADMMRDDDGVLWFDIKHAKGGKRRRVALSPVTDTALQRWDDARPTPRPRAKGRGEDAVVTTPVEDAERALLLTWRGVRMTPRDIQLMVHRRVKHMPAEVRREVTPHGLRHTAATLLLLSGAADVATVRDILGHESIATTSIYLDSADAHMVAAVRRHPVTNTTV